MRRLLFWALLLAGPLAYSQNYDTLRVSGQVFLLSDIPGGTFLMGDHGDGSYVDAIGESRDEIPVHPVTLSPFRMGATEVTNAQFELFFPEHRALRGIEGLSIGDDESVCNVSWNDAMEYCRRLSEATGRSFRLPTEAEWEYACRAGTSTDFSYGNVLPFSEWRHQRTERYKVPVHLGVLAISHPNTWGLYNMHGSLEEWCHDWYGPYVTGSSILDPAGPLDGDFRVTRGGSHNTPERYLRSTNRSAQHPDDCSVMVGFRIVEAAPIESPKLDRILPSEVFPVTPEPVDVSITPAFSTEHVFSTERAVFVDNALPSTSTNTPLFATPVPYVIAPTDEAIPFYHHNHQPAVTWASDGSLLAIWFSCEAESGREMVVLASRWTEVGGWSPAELFFDVPDRNMTGAALVRVGDRIVHIAGVGDAGDWRDLVLLIRYSFDGGRTWSHPVVAEPGHHERHQVIAGPIVTSDGAILLACDAGPGGQDGTSLHISRDAGLTFTDLGKTSEILSAGTLAPKRDRPAPKAVFSGTGRDIAGIHAGVVTLADGSIMAFGRGNAIDGRMPCSTSHDGGCTWTYSPTEFPAIGTGQRLILWRLNEGPLLLCSFDTDGLFAAVSYDEGASWPVKKRITDGSGTVLDGGAWTGTFTLDADHGEPKGYLAATQTPDGVIHLLSSRVHYRFNLSWLEQ